MNMFQRVLRAILVTCGKEIPEGCYSLEHFGRALLGPRVGPCSFFLGGGGLGFGV